MKSIVEQERAEGCFICGAGGPLERHHIFGGNPGRKWSEKYGLTVHLCCSCHRDNRKGVHADADMARSLHKIGQAAFERRYSRQKFYDVFGRYYLDDTEAKEPEETESRAEGFTFLKDENF